MIKLDIINEVVNRTGITKTKAEMAVETVFETMKKALAQGERIELRGFGIFNVRPRKNTRCGSNGRRPRCPQAPRLPGRVSLTRQSLRPATGLPGVRPLSSLPGTSTTA